MPRLLRFRWLGNAARLSIVGGGGGSLAEYSLPRHLSKQQLHPANNALLFPRPRRRNHVMTMLRLVTKIGIPQVYPSKGLQRTLISAPVRRVCLHNSLSMGSVM